MKYKLNSCCIILIFSTKFYYLFTLVSTVSCEERIQIPPPLVHWDSPVRASHGLHNFPGGQRNSDLPPLPPAEHLRPPHGEGAPHWHPVDPHGNAVVVFSPVAGKEINFDSISLPLLFIACLTKLSKGVIFPDALFLQHCGHLFLVICLHPPFQFNSKIHIILTTAKVSVEVYKRPFC